MRAEDVIEKVSLATSVDELDKTVLSISKHFGMDGYYYCNFKPMSGLQTVDHRNSDWLRRYKSNGYQQFDAISQELFATDISFTWEEVAVKNTSNKRQMKLLNEAREFGLNHGYHIISKETPFQGGSLCLYAKDRRDFTDSMKINRKTIDILGHLYHNKYESIKSRDIEVPNLAPREKECLTLASLGKTNDEIGTILSLSGNTVNSYIQSACGKLNVRTKIHAVVKAVQLQIIFPF